MQGVIIYSSFTSAYYLCFAMTTNLVLYNIEIVTYILFAFDIIFNFFRMYKIEPDNSPWCSRHQGHKQNEKEKDEFESDDKDKDEFK
jgi:hypothetical protein